VCLRHLNCALRVLNPLCYILGGLNSNFALNFTISHWQPHTHHSMQLHPTCSYHELLAEVRNKFSDEIGVSPFRLYLLPVQSESIDEKLRLKSENMQEFISKIYSINGTIHQLYVSNTDESPENLPSFDAVDLLSPLRKLDLKCGSGSKSDSVSSNTSKVSRNSKTSIRCKV
jgi:hypothetical protein